MDIFINHSRIDYRPAADAGDGISTGIGTLPGPAGIAGPGAGAPLTWGKMLQDILTHYIEENHHIIHIRVDDLEALSPQQIPALADQEIPRKTGKIDIITKDTFSITKDTFVEVFALIDSIRCEIPPCAALYRKQQTLEAIKIIKKIMSSIRPMIDFINSVGINFSLDFNKINSDRGLSLREEIGSFVESFSRLIKIKEQKDNNLIADYLEKHFNDDITAWSKAMKKLLREISQPPEHGRRSTDRRLKP